MYYGDFPEDHTHVQIPFNTLTSDDPSASCTITNLVAGDIKIHKDGNVAQKASADGVTVVVDFDGITGNHLVSIDTSDDTGAAGFWLAGHEYQVRIEGTTVDGATINAWIGSFSIERAGGTIALLKLIQAATITNAAGADIAADIIAIKAQTVDIEADTNELQTDDIPGKITTTQNDLDIITGASGVVIQDGSLVNASFGADALTAAKVAADVHAEAADAVWDELLTGASHNLATSAGRRLRQAADVMIIREETCQAGGGNDEVILDAGASVIDDFYVNDFVVLASGAGSGQVRHIDSYVGGTKTATVNRDWDTNPDATTEYIIKSDSTKHVHGFGTIAKAEINTEADTALTDYDPPTRAELTTDKDSIITEVDANETKIDAIKAQTDLVTAARMGALTDWINGGRLDLLLDAIPTTAMRGTENAATEAKQDIIDTVVDAIKVITDALTAASATKLALSAGTMVAGTVSWDNTNATTTVIYCDDITEVMADHYNGRIMIFTSGALQYQATDITDYELAAGEGKFTVTALTQAPANNVTFIIV